MTARRTRSGLLRGTQVGAAAVLLSGLFVMLGKGPWTRWVVPVVLIVAAPFFVGALRHRPHDDRPE